MQSYKEIEKCLMYLEPFRGSSLQGYFKGKKYMVQSYNTIIGIYDTEKQEGVITTHFYSSTTSRGQNLMRKCWDNVKEVANEL